MCGGVCTWLRNLHSLLANDIQSGVCVCIEVGSRDIKNEGLDGIRKRKRRKWRILDISGDMDEEGNKKKGVGMKKIERGRGKRKGNNLEIQGSE